MPHFVKATVIGVNTNRYSETHLKFLVTKIERPKTNGLADLTEQNVVLAVFTEDEFVEFSNRLEGEIQHE